MGRFLWLNQEAYCWDLWKLSFNPCIEPCSISQCPKKYLPEEKRVYYTFGFASSTINYNHDMNSFFYPGYSITWITNYYILLNIAVRELFLKFAIDSNIMNEKLKWESCIPKASWKYLNHRKLSLETFFLQQLVFLARDAHNHKS